MGGIKYNEMDWLKKITNQLGSTTQRIKEGLSTASEEIGKRGERVYNAMFPLLSPIPEERNKVKDIFDAIFTKDEEPTQPQVQEPQQENQPPVVEPTPVPTPTPIIDITPDGETRMYGRNPEVKKYKIENNVYGAINKAADEFQIPAAILFDIALKESSFNPTVTNTEVKDSEGNPTNPTGLFQFTDETWEQILNQYNDKSGMSLHLPNKNRFDPYTNAMAAAYLIKNGQLGKWAASKGVWGPYWPEKELIELGFYDQTIAYNK